jgi:DNA polymerase I-like protein with 3'-5' exonuclease and polymerase domains
MSKENLKIIDPRVKVLMDYRSGIGTCLQTFMRPWLEKSYENGRLHPNWNQVRQPRGSHSKGTRTGRLSSDDPNFQNVPTEFVNSAGDPLRVPDGLHPYPLLRSYCLPEKGHFWIKRDYSSQEIRILAHFEDGSLCQAYKSDSELDPHQMATELIFNLTGLQFDRKIVKITGFSIIYGSGAKGISQQLAIPYHEAAQLKEAYLSAMPGIRAVMNDVTLRGRAGDFIRTWGGRVYYKEPSDQFDFSYKLLNYLIQGSAADQTKESINDWDETVPKESLFLATVHDEINLSSPMETWEREMALLREAMNKDRLDVPVLSEGYVGTSWQDLEACS